MDVAILAIEVLIECIDVASVASGPSHVDETTKRTNDDKTVIANLEAYMEGTSPRS